MKNFEKELVKTPINIQFIDDQTEYVCFFNPSNEKSYYQVSDEFLMIVDALKVKEIKTWYEGSKKKRKGQDEEE